MRVTPNRVLFGLLDMAGRLEENSAVVSAAQQTFRTRSPELFSADDVNEADAMAELCLELNRAIMAAEGGIRSCPAFAGCYNEDLGTICYFNAGHTFRTASRHDRYHRTRGHRPAPRDSFPTLLARLRWLRCLREPPFSWFPRGLLEGRRKREEFGLERVKAGLQQAAANETAQGLCATMIEDVQQFMRRPPVHNDVTALALVRPAKT